MVQTTLPAFSPAHQDIALGRATGPDAKVFQRDIPKLIARRLHHQLTAGRFTCLRRA